MTDPGVVPKPRDEAGQFRLAPVAVLILSALAPVLGVAGRRDDALSGARVHVIHLGLESNLNPVRVSTHLLFYFTAVFQ